MQRFVNLPLKDLDLAMSTPPIVWPEDWDAPHQQPEAPGVPHLRYEVGSA
jgi:hypothetical protein